MHIERVLSLINLLDIPEKKRRFWPQKSLVVLAQDKTVLDVIQFFSMDESDEVLRKACQYYKHTRMFHAEPGWYTTVHALQDHIDWCFAPTTPDTYIVGKGLIKNLPPEEQKRLLSSED